MIYKLKTSKNTMKIFEEIGNSTNFAPYILSKLSISMSIKSGKALTVDDFNTDINGLEINRQTITAEWDLLYKCLIEMLENRYLNEDEYFPKYIKAHLDRGAKFLYSEFKYNRDFILSLINDKIGL